MPGSTTWLPECNAYDELDPREIEQGLLSTIRNAELSELAEQTLSKIIDVPDAFEIEATGANIEELLHELYVDNYLLVIESHDGPLSDIPLIRRPFVLNWRAEFLRRPLPMLRQAPRAREIIIELIRKIWTDILVMEGVRVR